MPFGLISAGIGAVGGILSSNSAAKSQAAAAEAAKAPWKEQQPFVIQGYNSASDALKQAQAMGTYQGQYTADMDPLQTQGLNAGANLAQTSGVAGSQAQYQTGMNTIGNTDAFGSNANSLYAQSQVDPTQQILGNAAQYANNPYLDSQIDAASRDVTRNLNENQLTGLDLNATGAGNMNSSRTGVAQGIMERGAADQIGDISATMRSNAYNTGLAASQNQYNTGVTQAQTANNQLLQSGTNGASQITAGLNTGYNAANVTANAGAAFQTQQQNVLNGQKQQFTDQQNNGLDLTGKYMGIINGNFGGGSTAAAPNTATSAISGALGGLGLYGQLTKGNTTTNPNASTVGTTSAGYQNVSNDSLGTTGDYNYNGSNYFGSYA